MPRRQIWRADYGFDLTAHQIGDGPFLVPLRRYSEHTLIRPPKLPVYLKLHFAPGECAQVLGIF
jgi:hypothetical protein